MYKRQTRTYALGELTDEERRYYTYVLKANIGIARTVFMEGCSGANLDIMSVSYTHLNIRELAARNIK